MKKDRLFMMGTLAVMLAFGLMLAGCGDSGDPTSPGPGPGPGGDNPGPGPNPGGVGSLPITVEGVTYTLKSVPGGTVTARTGEYDGPFYSAGTTPVIVNAFSIGETEITYELWYAVKKWAVDNKGYTFDNQGREGSDGTDGAEPTAAKAEPVTEISWRDVVVWCNAYSEAAGKTPVYYLEGTTNFGDTARVLRESESSSVSGGSGKAEKAVINDDADGFRLPTEAEWEYAARGGVPSTTTPWTYSYAGSNTVGDVAVYTSNTGSKTAPVKSKTGGTYKGANSLGLYDMSGNVREWCWDIHSGTNRVLRGGSWDSDAVYCLVTSRSSYSYPYYEDDNFGFRVVCNGN